MKQRWLVVAVGLPLLLVVLLVLPAWATMLLVCGISGVAAYELLHVAGKTASKRVYAVTIVAAVLQCWAVYDQRVWSDVKGLIPYGSQFGAPIDKLWVMPLTLMVVLFCMAVFSYGTERAIPFVNLPVAIMGGVMFPMMYSCIFLLRMHPDYGRLYVMMPFAVAFIGDALAMYGGMIFKGPKMAPHVSPNKTWSGGISGMVGGALGLMLFGLIGNVWLGYTPHYLKLLEVGLVANALGQMGDLSMSLIKREMGIKDYSHLFLTHGGMLDRFDSSMFIAPIIYLFVAGGVL